jgi:hypothetical protein
MSHLAMMSAPFTMQTNAGADLPRQRHRLYHKCGKSANGHVPSPPFDGVRTPFSQCLWQGRMILVGGMDAESLML